MSIRFRLVSQPTHKLISNSEQLLNAIDLCPITFGVILPANIRGKNSSKCKLNQRTLDENLISKVSTIVCKEVLYEHDRILKDKKNKWSTMARTFDTTFVTELILKLPEMNHSAKNKMPFDQQTIKL